MNSRLARSGLPLVRPATLVILFLASIAATAAAPPEGGPLLSAHDLQADAAVLRRTYEALHPGLTRYQTDAELGAHFAELDHALDHDQTVLEAFLAVTRFTATLRCGHSYPNFYHQPRAIGDLLKAGHDRLPFQFVWIDRRMVVTRNLSNDPRLVPGTVIATVDGVPAQHILESLMPLVRADGHNDAKRINALQVQGFDRIELFDVYRSLVFPMRGETFSFETSSGPLTLAGLTHEQRLATLRTAKSDGGNPLGWTLAFPDERSSVLTMPTWVAFNTPWDWKDFVHDAFETLARRGTTHLVIDLRGNEGGSDVGDEIASYLVAGDTTVLPVVRSTRYRRVPDALRPALDTWDPSFFDWGPAAMGPDQHGDYRLLRDADKGDGAVVQPHSPRFAGHVDVLIDAANSSATFGFAQLVQSRHLATLVGEATGGNLRGISGGAFFFVRLPMSHIEVDLPLIAQTPEATMPDRGLLPDVTAVPTVRDIADGTDVALQTALARR